MSRPGGLSAEDRAAILAAQKAKEAAIVNQPTTGAERIGAPPSPTVTQKVTEIKTQRVQQQIQQIEQTKPKVEGTLTTLNDTITKLSNEPGKYLIEDPDTGQMRSVIGRDIDQMKQQKNQLETWLKTADIAKPLLIEYDTALKQPRTTTKTTYAVKYFDGHREQTKTFDTIAEAEKFAARINKDATKQAQTRAQERAFQGLSLQEKAAVVLQERVGETKAPTYRTVTLGRGDTQRLEELIETGQISSSQVIEYSRTGKTEVGVLLPSQTTEKGITVAKAMEKAGKIISDDATMLFFEASKLEIKLNPKLDPSYTLKPRGTPLTKEEFEQVKIRADIFKNYTMAGIVLGVAATLNPKTWTSLPKDAIKFARNPVAITAATALTLKASYDANPIATSGLLLGSVIGSTLTFKAAGTTWRYGLRPPIAVVGGKIKTTMTPGVQVLAAAVRETYSTYKSEAATASATVFRAFRDTPLDDAVQLNKLILEPNELYSKGIRLSLWEQYRQWKKLDFTYVPTDPNIAVQSLRLAKNAKQEAAFIAAAGRMGVHNDFVEFLKIQRTYLDAKLSSVGTTGTFGEFLQSMKTKKIDAPLTILDKAKIWYMLQTAKNVKNAEVIEIAKTGLVFTKGTWSKTPFGFEGTETEQLQAYQKLRDYWKQFDPSTDYPMPTPWEQEAAIKFFKDEIHANNNPLGMVETESKSLYATLVKAGATKAQATEAASDYAVALTIIAAMKTASPEETREYLQNLSTSMNRLNGMKFIDENIRFTIASDIVNRISMGIDANEFKGFDDISTKATELSETLKKLGEIPQDKYESMLKDLTEMFNVEDIINIQELTPTIIPIEDVTQLQKIDFVPEQVTITEIEEKPPILTPKQRKELSDIKLRMRGFGSKEVYKVRFAYHKGNTQSVRVEARGYIDAMGKAVRIRKSSRYLPKSATLERIQ